MSNVSNSLEIMSSIVDLTGDVDTVIQSTLTDVGNFSDSFPFILTALMFASQSASVCRFSSARVSMLTYPRATQSSNCPWTPAHQGWLKIFSNIWWSLVNGRETRNSTVLGMRFFVYNQRLKVLDWWVKSYCWEIELRVFLVSYIFSLPYLSHQISSLYVTRTNKNNDIKSV